MPKHVGELKDNKNAYVLKRLPEDDQWVTPKHVGELKDNKNAYVLKRLPEDDQ